ncbi:hypothetical protein ES708_23668 [subsurface metagenome]
MIDFTFFSDQGCAASRAICNELDRPATGLSKTFVNTYNLGNDLSTFFNIYYIPVMDIEKFNLIGIV